MKTNAHRVNKAKWNEIATIFKSLYKKCCESAKDKKYFFRVSCEIMIALISNFVELCIIAY